MRQPMRVHKPLQGQRRFRLRMQGAYEHRYSPERNAAADEPVTQLCDHLVGLHCGSRTIDEPIHNRPYIATRHYTRPSCANCDGGSHRTQQPGRNKLKTRTDATGTIQRVRMLNWSLRAHPVDSRQRSNSVAFGRVGMWRGGCRLTISVAAPFVWRCLSRSPRHKSECAPDRLRSNECRGERSARRASLAFAAPLRTRPRRTLARPPALPRDAFAW